MYDHLLTHHRARGARAGRWALRRRCYVLNQLRRARFKGKRMVSIERSDDRRSLTLFFSSSSFSPRPARPFFFPPTPCLPPSRYAWWRLGGVLYRERTARKASLECGEGSGIGRGPPARPPSSHRRTRRVRVCARLLARVGRPRGRRTSGGGHFFLTFFFRPRFLSFSACAAIPPPCWYVSVVFV